MKVLFVDNFDSFTYNLVEYVSEQRLPADDGDRRGGDGDDGDEYLDIDIDVVKNNASLARVREADPDAIVISPGPGHPRNERDVGITSDVLREVSPEVPTFGVCLGLEAAVYEYGGEVGHAPEPIHGKAFPINHDGEGAFAGLDQGFRGGRYHSLIATEVPDCFEVSATTDHDGTELVMGARHREHPIECVQFHPESVLTGVGREVVRNFLTECVPADS